MKKKIKLINIIFPNKSVNVFIFMVMIFGVISGSIFLMKLGKGDKDLVIKQISNFIQNVADNSIDYGQALRNSLIINYLFIVVIFILGLSMIGIIVNIFICYLKGFLVGFSIAAIFLTYGYKGILVALIYSFPSQIFFMIVVLGLSIYSVMFSLNLLRIIFSKKGNQRLMLKKYFAIFMICIVVCFVSSLMEVYLFPHILKLVVRFYIS